jgi:HK97 family phage portal protein
MNLITRLFDQIRDNRAETTAIQSRFAGGAIIPWQAGRAQYLPRRIETYDHESYRRIALIFRCVQYLSNAAGTAPLRVYEPDSQEDDNAHPLRALLARPNPGMGEGRFFSFVAMNMAVTSFVVIEKERDRAGNIIGLWPLRSEWIRPVPRQQDQPDWEYRVPGYQEPFMLPAEDVIAIPFADTPDMSPIGMGPLEAALREAQISSALVDFLKVFMDRGGVPLYALIPQDEGPAAAQWKKQETKDAFMDAWRQRYGGLHNAGDPMPLVGVKDIKRVGLDFNELAYADLNNRMDAAICQAFGIPPILVSAQVGLERSTFSNTAEARKSFYEDTMTYLWARIDDAFTRQLLPEFEWRPGWDIRFDTSAIPAFQDNENELWGRTTAAFQAGEISRHTSQRLKGVDLHGPDEIMMPFNVIPLPVALRSSVTVHALHALRALPDGHDPTAPKFVYRDGRRYVNEARLSPVEREQRAAVVATNQKSIVALSSILEPHVGAFFAEQKERVLSQIGLVERSLPGNAPERRFAEAVDWAFEDDALSRIFAQWWESVAETALGNAESLLGGEIAWNIVNPYIADVQGVLGQRIVGINATTRTEIEDTLTKLMGEGTDVPSMGKAIEDLFDQTFKNRHLTVARTESMVGYGEASTMAYEASGVVDRVQVMDNASHTESYKGAADGLTCAGRNGLVVPLNRGMFHIGSDHPNGSASLAPVLSGPALGEV